MFDVLFYKVETILDRGFIVNVFGPIFALAFPSRLAFRQNDPNYARGARKTRGIFGQNLVSFLPIARRLTSLNQFLAINRASRLAFSEIRTALRALTTVGSQIL